MSTRSNKRRKLQERVHTLRSLLARTEDIQRALDESSETAITDIDGRILYVNDRFCALSGYSREELIGEDHRVVNSGLHPKEFFRELWTTILRGEVWRGEICNMAKSGALLWLDTTIVPVPGRDGKPHRFVALRHDITRRKRAEEDLARARDAALKAAQAKADFLANMSHEIRTPLGGIIGTASLLRKMELGSEQMDHVETVLKSSEILLMLVNDILDFSKIEAGKLNLEFIDFSLPEIAEDIKRLLQPTAAEKGLSLIIDIPPDVPSILRSDPVRLKQCLTNLIGNAIKFTQKGRVCLNVRCLQRSRKTARLRFEVEDTGIGIPAGDRPHIFDAFTQADSSTTRRYGGSGLGLTIARRIVDLMGGRLDVLSTEGRGSTFHFTLGFVIGETEGVGKPADRQPAPVPQNTKKLLIAEDNAVNRKMLLAMARNLGYDADLAGNGGEVLDALGRSDYDIVLMDCQMPVMDGYEAARRIRAREGSVRLTRIIAVTAHAMPGDREKALAAGMDDYLAKPIRIEDLKSALSRTETPSNVPIQGPIDETVIDSIRDLQTDDDPHFLEGLIITYLEDAPKRVRSIEEALRRKDLDAVRAAAHTLKGSSRNMGAVRLGEICQAVEESAKKGAIGDATGQLAELRAEFERVRDRLQDLT